MDFKLLRIAFALLLPLLWVREVWAVDCPQEDYELTTQAEVDALGATGCDSISGNLRIRDSTDITNVDGLANITSVEGSLLIYRNDALTNLDGLANITSVGGTLYIAWNFALTNLNGLAGLTSVGGDLYIGFNPILANCEAVAPLLGWPNGPPDDAVGGGIWINGNTTSCNLIAQVLASYTPPPPPGSDRFNALLQVVQATRGADNSRQTQVTSDSSSDAGETRQLVAREGTTAQAKAMSMAGEPAAIPATPHHLMLMMVGLVGLFGLRRLRA